MATNFLNTLQFPHHLTHQVGVGYLLNKTVKFMYALQSLGFTFGYKLLGKLSKVNFRGLWFVIAKKTNKKTYSTFLSVLLITAFVVSENKR